MLLGSCRWKLCALTAFLIMSFLAHANITSDLYQVAIEAETQTDKERHALLKQGLIQVLERASGGREVAVEPVVKKALKRPTDYVEQYTYQDDQLLIRYSSDLVNRLLHELGHTVWGTQRPSVVLWLALEEQDKRRVVGTETDPTLEALMAELSEQRGIPLILPLMDLEDVALVNVDTVWNVDYKTLQRAAERYHAQAILVGRLHQKSPYEGDWHGQWSLVSDSMIHRFEGDARDLETVLSQGIRGSTQQLVSRFGEQRSETAEFGQPFLISVEEIRSATDFSQLEAYLRKLSQVEEVNVSQVLGSTTIFEIIPRGENGRERLERALSFDRHLAVVPNETRHLSIDNIELSYRWCRPIAQPSESLVPLDDED